MIRPQKVQLMKEGGLENSSGKEAARKGSSKETGEPAGQPGDPAYSLGDGQGQRSDLTDWEFLGGQGLRDCISQEHPGGQQML